VTQASIEPGDLLELLPDHGERIALTAREPAEAGVRAETQVRGLLTEATTSHFSVYSSAYEVSSRQLELLAKTPLKSIRVQIGDRRHTRLLDGADRKKLMKAAACFLR